MLCEFLIDQYQRNFNVPSLIIRSSPVYGTESDRPKFIWNFLGKARAGEEIITHEYINGFPALDLIHVDDLRRAITSAVACNFQGTFNVGTGILTSTAEIARLIVDQLKSNSAIKHVKIDSFTGNIAMDTRKAETGLNWKPEVELKEGLKSIIENGVNNESE